MFNIYVCIIFIYLSLMAEKLDFQIGLFQNGFNIKITFFEYLEA